MMPHAMTQIQPQQNHPQLETELHRHFGLRDFRRGQREIIESALNGRDVLAVLPTGGGKSLCYQLPATVMGKLVVVISPLIALMRDQVAGLKRANVPAGSIHSGQSDDDKRAVFRQMGEGGAFLLYVSPERTQKDGFKAWIKQSGVAMFAVDEAHCVSQWGHDFREEYSQLKILKELCPGRARPGPHHFGHPVRFERHRQAVESVGRGPSRPRILPAESVLPGRGLHQRRV